MDLLDRRDVEVSDEDGTLGEAEFDQHVTVEDMVNYLSQD